MSSAIKNALAPVSENRKSPVLSIICSLITVAILITGLWPFNIHPDNKVEWLQNGNGIRFSGRGIVFSPGPLAMPGTAPGNASLTIELRVRPDKEYNNMVPSVLTLYDNAHSEQIIFGQWKTQLIIRVPAQRPGSQRRYHEVAIGNALVKETTHLITVTSGKEATDIYVDGKFNRRFPRYSLVPDDERPSGNLILGNSPEGTQSWNGAFFGLAIYDRILTDKEVLDHYLAWQKRGQPLLPGEKTPIALYFFDEHGGEQIRDHSGAGNHLLVPATFHPLRRIILGLPAKDQWFSRSNLKDVAINVLGFAPFGFFLSAWTRQVKTLPAPHASGIAILAGFFLSLAIELIQVYIPGRDSSSLDVLSNVLGTAAGVLLMKYALPAFQKVAR